MNRVYKKICICDSYFYLNFTLMNTETLKIVCSPFVPEESIDEFASNFLSIIDVSRERLPIERNRTLENFEVKELIDFTVHFISNNEFLQSVFKQVGIEAIKEVFKKTFSSVSKNKRDGGCSMEICLCYKDLKATFKVNGKYTKQDIQKCFNAFSDLIVSGQLFSDSKNPQFQCRHIVV